MLSFQSLNGAVRVSPAPLPTAAATAPVCRRREGEPPGARRRRPGRMRGGGVGRCTACRGAAAQDGQDAGTAASAAAAADGQLSADTQAALRRLHTSPLMLCIRMDDATLALEAARAAMAGGVRAVEITMTTPSALSLIAQLRAEAPHVCVGAGTVLSEAQAEQVKNAGAQFAMSPISDERVISECNRLDLLMIPGAATPTEIFNAYHYARAPAVKVFPANLCGDVDFVKAMSGPLPHIPLVPTSGVDLQSLSKYLSLRNVLAVGTSRQILPADALRERQWATVAALARRWMEAVERARRSTVGTSLSAEA